MRADGLGLRSKFKSGAANSEGGVRLGPLPENLLEWHFSFTGPENSTYQHGVYHGRILLSKHYPHKAPRIQLLTPNGRFHVKTDICLSASVSKNAFLLPLFCFLSCVHCCVSCACL